MSKVYLTETISYNINHQLKIMRKQIATMTLAFAGLLTTGVVAGGYGFFGDGGEASGATIN